MNKSEQIVFDICKKAFLSLWTIANPIGKESGKELCDALIVFENNIIIISIKDITYKPTENYSIGWDRWISSAIEKSLKQLKGAKRILELSSVVRSKDGKVIRELPPINIRKYFLLSISFGSKREIPISIPLSEHIFHYFDEYSYNIILSELDTISDFIEYLTKKKLF